MFSLQQDIAAAPEGVPVAPVMSGPAGARRIHGHTNSTQRLQSPATGRRPITEHRSRGTARRSQGELSTGFTRFSTRRPNLSAALLMSSSAQNSLPQTGTWGRRIDVPAASILSPLQRRTEGYYKRLEQDRASQRAAAKRDFNIVKALEAADIADRSDEIANLERNALKYGRDYGIRPRLRA